jgi:pyruvate formate lyase activating enzyme
MLLEKLPITSITPFTFQDYPEHTACILWFSGCNMACSYCHNPELVRGELQKLPFDKVNSFLLSRRSLLEAVVLSGGECTLSPYIIDFARYVKSLGFKLKIDTNGTNPDALSKMLAENLLDFVALDFKAPQGKFAEITKFANFDKFQKSLQLLCNANIALEVRTTYHSSLLNPQDLQDIMATLDELKFSGNYAVQKCRIDKTLGGIIEENNFPDSLQNSNSNFNLSIRAS